MSYAMIQGTADMNMCGDERFSHDVDGDDASVTISFPHNVDGLPEEFTCRHCGSTITQDGVVDPWTDESGDDECGDNDDPDAAHEPTGNRDQAHVSKWLNSASVTLKGDDGVVCSISVGDPRGGFTWTVRKLDDGRLIMHVPYPGEGQPHARLTPLHDGTYLIGG